MVWEIIKKQGLIFIRNPQQLFLLLMLPIILIIILSVSLSSFMNGDTIQINAKVGLIHHENEKDQLEKFAQEVQNSNLPEEAKLAVISAAKQLPLITILREGLEEIELIELEKVPLQEKETALNNDDYTVVIEIPENFLIESYRSIYLDDGEPGKMKIFDNQGKQLGATAVNSIIEHFQEQLTLTTFAISHNIDTNMLQQTLEKEIGHIETIGQSKKIGSKEYYTIGMSVMNALFMATAIASFAYMEKQTQVFNRIILSNMSRWSYFIGLFVSGTIFSFIQLLIIFIFSWLVYGITWHVPSFLIVTICLALAVGGLSVLLAAISYRFNSETVINLFSSAIVSILALLGGSFFPIGDYSKLIQLIGDFTPNGAAMTSYMNLLQGDSLIESLRQLIYLIAFTVLVLLTAISSFPKRGQV